MEKEVQELAKTHRVKKENDNYIIFINKPEDFVFDISDIAVRCNPKDNSKIVACSQLPENIRDNIHKFSFLTVKEFVNRIEKSLNVFLMGKTPSFTREESERMQKMEDSACLDLREGELPLNYKLPTNNSVTSNIKFDVSKSDNILIVFCNKISVAVRCIKCNGMNSISETSSCINCRAEIGLVYVPVIDSEYLGFMSLKKCLFVSFNPMAYQYICQECNKAYESRKLSVGEISKQKCYGCFKDLKIKINSVEYYQKKMCVIVPGEALPGNGTCKHYGKSYRWFRFSCCQSLYPCDICHDEQSGHKSLIANKMVCGFCSKEQSVKKECECGKNTVKKNTQFWEGGKGNRDKATMNRRDSKKYK